MKILNELAGISGEIMNSFENSFCSVDTEIMIRNI